MNTSIVRLTERERTVLEMLAAGYAMNAIMLELHPKGDHKGESVDAWASALEKLGAVSTPHAIALAIRGGHIL